MNDDLIKEAREAIATSYEFDRDNRREAVEDLRFVAGFQWSQQALSERRGRPIVTINRSGQFLRQVSNPIRQNMPTLKVEPDGKDDMEGAEVINGIFRRIQYNSSASHVYANAVEHMIACGVGWFRIVSDYTDEESFDQELFIKRIYNPLSVYPDPSSLEPDRSDMNWCVVSEMIPRKAFEAMYPGKKSEGMDTPTNGVAGNSVAWGTQDYVRVAEYWRRKEVQKQIARLSDGQTVNITDMPPRQLSFLKANGMILDVRPSKGYAVEMNLVSGAEQLAETYTCPCRWIPVVPVIGAEVPLEQGIYRHGLIRFQREIGRLKNYFLSVAAESMGQQPKAPYTVNMESIKKYKGLWDKANISPTPYLPYDGDKEPKRMEPPPLPAGFVQFAQVLTDEEKAATGIYDAALGARSNETSGIAINGRIEQGNQANFHYIDNLEHSLEHTGRILLDMIPKIYDTQRVLRMKGEDGTEKEAAINMPTISDHGEPMMINDLSKMKFKSVRVVMGPSYASRRQEAVNQLAQLVQSMPQIGQLGGDIIVRNMDFDGAEELAERLRSVLPPQVLAITNPEMAQQMQPPDPMDDPVVRADVELKAAQAMKTFAEAQAVGFQIDAGMQGDPVDPLQQATSHAAMIQQQAAATEAHHRANGAALDNALKVKQLREPPPQPASNGQAGTRAAR